MRQNVFEPLAKANTVRFACCGEGILNNETLPAGFTSDKETVLSDDRNSSVETFGRIVVDVQSGILQELFEIIFDTQSIENCLRDRGERALRFLENSTVVKKFWMSREFMHPPRFSIHHSFLTARFFSFFRNKRLHNQSFFCCNLFKINRFYHIQQTLIYRSLYTDSSCPASGGHHTHRLHFKSLDSAFVASSLQISHG